MKVATIIIGIKASGNITVLIMVIKLAPASWAASIKALGTDCNPEVIINVANGNETQIEPIITASIVDVICGTSIPNE